jgi:hypothetical protein
LSDATNLGKDRQLQAYSKTIVAWQLRFNKVLKNAILLAIRTSHSFIIFKVSTKDTLWAGLREMKVKILMFWISFLFADAEAKMPK